ncbi:Uncharacterized protein PBTT_01486 [Plasmodiophora brassicae]|uniref:Uncharacterized protein n=1 Tax=Plasmodiophora brassicae TaxID=37360 RepID=A0A3P3Y224_PLABS|nr:unnamed protein product [Plasmodiophora brassicae]
MGRTVDAAAKRYKSGVRADLHSPRRQGQGRFRSNLPTGNQNRRCLRPGHDRLGVYSQHAIRKRFATTNFRVPRHHWHKWPAVEVHIR